MSKDFTLDAKEHERKYQEIERDLFEGTHPASHPCVVIMGGQPGSGKSRLLEASRDLFLDNSVVVINGDELRQYHPHSNEILKLDDRLYAERTDQDSRIWTKRAFDRAIETNRNIVFESTLRESGPISETMLRLREEKYRLVVRIVATHERTSVTSILKRYEEQKAVKGFGRWSELSSHDAGYVGMPKTVEYIEKNAMVDRLEVHNRDGALLFFKELQNGIWNRPEFATEVIAQERMRVPSEFEVTRLRADWQKIFQLMELRNASLKDRQQALGIQQKVEQSLI